MRVSGEDAEWAQRVDAPLAESERRTTVAGARADGAAEARSERRRRATAPERPLERVSRAPGEHRDGTGTGGGR
jgi:hypothetical protein